MHDLNAKHDAGNQQWKSLERKYDAAFLVL
jgi:hypothetical protein